MIAIASDELRLEDVDNCLDGVVVAGAMPFRKIFDMTHATLMVGDADMMTLAARIRAYLKIDRLGPLAIIAVSERAYQ